MSIAAARPDPGPTPASPLSLSEAVLDAIPAAVYVCAADGRILQHNRRAVELWGRSPALNDTDERFCGAFRLYRLDGTHLPHAQTPMEKVLRTGEPERDQEVVIERPDGSRITALVSIQPLKGPSGEVLGAINCFQDITQRKLVEERLRESDRRTSALLNALPAAIYTTDAEGRITYFNKAAAELAGREPRIGEDRWCVSWRLATADGVPLPHEECPMALTLKEKRPVRDVEAIAIRPDGSKVPFLPHPTPMFDRDGALEGAVNMLVDISERKRIEVELRAHSDRADTLNEIASTLASDLDLERIVQVVTEKATRLSGAQFGAFFYNVMDESGGHFTLYALSGAPRSAFEDFSVPRKTALFQPTFDGIGPVRLDDVRKDPRYGRSAPHFGMPKGHLPVTSYLAVPVTSRSGQTIGGLFFGHEEPGVFTEATVALVEGIAAHAALAVDNAALLRDAQREIEQRRRAEESAATHLREQAALYALTERLTRADSMTAINEAALDAITTTLGCARASVLLFDRSGVMRFAAWRGLSDAYRAAVEGHSPWTQGSKDVRPIVVEDVSTVDLAPHIRDAVVAEGIKSLAFIPILANGSLAGKFMTYFDAPTPFTERRLELAVTISSHLGFSLERKQAEEQRALLINELNHRVKNTLATVQSLALHSLRQTDDSETALAAFEARLSALSRAHDLLAQRSWGWASLADVIERSLEAFLTPERFLRDGPSAKISPKQAVALSMALHELATNAHKYGALSTTNGRVDIRWTVDDGELALTWTERGGPPVSPPSRRGFGTRLIGRSLAHDLGAEASIDFRPEGVVAVLRSPLEIA